MIVPNIDLWNRKDLKPPPRNTYMSKSVDIDIKLFKNILEEAVDFYSNQQHLYNEAALMSRCIYRMKMKFRNSKDLKSLEKINKCLLNYLSIDIDKIVRNLYLLTPDHIRTTFDTYLPTKNAVDYILVRLQGLAKLMARIVETTKISAYYYQDRLKLGHFWNLAIVGYGLVSRIYVISTKITKFTCDLYTKLLLFSSKLKNTGANWLPEDYTLPKDLKDWLGVEWIYADDNIIEILDETNPILQFIDFTQDSDDSVEFCDEYFILNDTDGDIINKHRNFNLPKSSPIQRGDDNIFHNNVRDFGIEDIDVGDVINDTVEFVDEYYDLSTPVPKHVPNTEKNGEKLSSTNKKKSVKEKNHTKSKKKKNSINENEVTTISIEDSILDSRPPIFANLLNIEKRDKLLRSSTPKKRKKPNLTNESNDINQPECKKKKTSLNEIISIEDSISDLSTSVSVNVSNIDESYKMLRISTPKTKKRGLSTKSNDDNQPKRKKKKISTNETISIEDILLNHNDATDVYKSTPLENNKKFKKKLNQKVEDTGEVVDLSIIANKNNSIFDNSVINKMKKNSPKTNKKNKSPEKSIKKKSIKKPQDNVTFNKKSIKSENNLIFERYDLSTQDNVIDLNKTTHLEDTENIKSLNKQVENKNNSTRNGNKKKKRKNKHNKTNSSKTSNNEATKRVKKSKRKSQNVSFDGKTNQKKNKLFKRKNKML